MHYNAEQSLLNFPGTVAAAPGRQRETGSETVALTRHSHRDAVSFGTSVKVSVWADDGAHLLQRRWRVRPVCVCRWECVCVCLTMESESEPEWLRAVSMTLHNRSLIPFSHAEHI